MNGVQPVGHADGGHGGVPMGADHDDGARLRQALRLVTQRRAGGAGRQGKGGRAVGHKQTGQGGVHLGARFLGGGVSVLSMGEL